MSGVSLFPLLLSRPLVQTQTIARMVGHGMGELFTKTQQTQNFPGHKGASEPFLLGWVGRISHGSSGEMVLSSQCCAQASPGQAPTTC